jgi:hypothetical protein
MKVQIMLKSGASIEVDLEELQIGRSPISGELTSLTWTGQEGGVGLQFLDISEVAAITSRGGAS